MNEHCPSLKNNSLPDPTLSMEALNVLAAFLSQKKFDFADAKE